MRGGIKLTHTPVGRMSETARLAARDGIRAAMRHQRPTCETCNSVGVVETSAGAIPCEECSA